MNSNSSSPKTNSIRPIRVQVIFAKHDAHPAKLNRTEQRELCIWMRLFFFSIRSNGEWRWYLCRRCVRILYLLINDWRSSSCSSRKNLDAFDKETRNANMDITDVDASADLFGKPCSILHVIIVWTLIFFSRPVRQSFYGEISQLYVALTLIFFVSNSCSSSTSLSDLGMTKEVSNLIKENNELLETKWVDGESLTRGSILLFIRNALNVLKDDLLMKIEEFSKWV